MAKKKNEGSGEMFILFFIVAACLLFLPFLIFTANRYRKLKRKYNAMPNLQRVYDVKLIFTNFAAVVLLVALIALCLFLFTYYITAYIYPEALPYVMLTLLIAFPIAMFWPLKKAAEYIAIDYMGVMFNDNDGTMIFPADSGNQSLSDIVRLRFLHRISEQDIISISRITSVTREKGVKFFIHGDFGSRLFYFSSKQKRDECLSALQARTRVKGGRDYGY